MITRRLFAGSAVTAVVASRFGVAHAEDKVIKIGADLSLTGADAESATRVKDGIIMAIDAGQQEQDSARLYL